MIRYNYTVCQFLCVCVCMCVCACVHVLSSTSYGSRQLSNCRETKNWAIIVSVSCVLCVVSDRVGVGVGGWNVHGLHCLWLIG